MLSNSAVVRPVALPFYSEKKSTHTKRAEENEKQDIYEISGGFWHRGALPHCGRGVTSPAPRRAFSLRVWAA
jgi:hypothetical protein